MTEAPEDFLSTTTTFMTTSPTTPQPQQQMNGVRTPSDWSNINWSTTYSSDEDSQSSDSTQFLFQDGDEGEEPVMVMEPLLIPLGTAHTSTPPRTRRRTHSQAPLDVLVSLENNNNLDADDSGGSDGEAVESIRRSRYHFSKRYSNFLRPVRVVFSLLALSTTVLLGVPPPSSHSSQEVVVGFTARHQPQNATSVVVNDKAGSIIIQGSAASVEPPVEAQAPQEVSRGVLERQDQLHRQQQQRVQLRRPPGIRLIHAVGSKDTPLTFRKHLQQNQMQNVIARFYQQEPYHLHALYVSVLIAIILWSVREVHAHHRRRGSTGGCDNHCQQQQSGIAV